MKCEINDCEFHQYSNVFYIKSEDFPNILSWPDVEELIQKGFGREIFQAVPSDLYDHDTSKYELITRYAMRRVHRIVDAGRFKKR